MELRPCRLSIPFPQIQIIIYVAVSSTIVQHRIATYPTEKHRTATGVPSYRSFCKTNGSEKWNNATVENGDAEVSESRNCQVQYPNRCKGTTIPHIQVQLVTRLRMYFQKAKMPVSSGTNRHRKHTALKHEWYEWPNPLPPLQPISL